MRSLGPADIPLARSGNSSAAPCSCSVSKTCFSRIKDEQKQQKKETHVTKRKDGSNNKKKKKKEIQQSHVRATVSSFFLFLLPATFFFFLKSVTRLLCFFSPFPTLSDAQNSRHKTNIWKKPHCKMESEKFFSKWQSKLENFFLNLSLRFHFFCFITLSSCFPLFLFNNLLI